MEHYDEVDWCKLIHSTNLFDEMVLTMAETSIYSFATAACNLRVFSCRFCLFNAVIFVCLFSLAIVHLYAKSPQFLFFLSHLHLQYWLGIAFPRFFSLSR